MVQILRLLFQTVSVCVYWTTLNITAFEHPRASRQLFPWHLPTLVLSPTKSCNYIVFSSQAQITSYYRDALGFILVYDVTDEPSFNRISDWLSIIEQHAREKDFKKLLFGSKSHCWCEETRQITTKRGQEYAREHGMRFVESADLDEAINFIAKDILNKDHQQPLFGRSELLCDFDK